MAIRILTKADAAAFRALRLRALQEHPEAFTSSVEEDALKPLSATEQRIAGDSGNVFWGAFADGEIRGMIGLTRDPRAKALHKGDIVAMYVAPELGRRGLARALRPPGFAHHDQKRAAVRQNFLEVIVEVNAGRHGVDVHEHPRSPALYEALVHAVGHVGGRVVAAILAALWLFVAWAYMLQRYDPINFAARYCAAGFVVQAALLIWAGVCGYLAFGELPDRYALFGSALIVGSGLYVAWGHRAKRNEEPDSAIE